MKLCAQGWCPGDRGSVPLLSVTVHNTNSNFHGVYSTSQARRIPRYCSIRAPRGSVTHHWASLYPWCFFSSVFSVRHMLRRLWRPYSTPAKYVDKLVIGQGDPTPGARRSVARPFFFGVERRIGRGLAHLAHYAGGRAFLSFDTKYQHRGGDTICTGPFAILPARQSGLSIFALARDAVIPSQTEAVMLLTFKSMTWVLVVTLGKRPGMERKTTYEYLGTVAVGSNWNSVVHIRKEDILCSLGFQVQPATRQIDVAGNGVGQGEGKANDQQKPGK